MHGAKVLRLDQIGKLPIDANLRHLYQGPKRSGRGRRKTYDGKVNWDDLSRFEQVETDDDHLIRYHQVVNHVQFQCHLNVVLVVDTKHRRRAVLFSTDVDSQALTIYFNIKPCKFPYVYRSTSFVTGSPAPQKKAPLPAAAPTTATL